MMSFFSFPVRRPGALPTLLALALLAAILPAGAAEEDTGGTFSTPGYPQRNVPPGATATRVPPGGQPGTIGGRPTGAGRRRRRQRGARPPRRAFPRRVEPPPRPNEFQRFVEAATGRLLPNFGASFFADAPTPSQPVDNVPVSADYVVGPGDEMIIRAWGSIDVDYRTHGRPQRHAQPAEDRQLQRRWRQGGRPRAQPARADRAAVTPTSISTSRSASCARCKVFVVGPAQRPGVVHAVEPVDAALGGGRGGRARPDGSMRKIGLRRDGTDRFGARRLRVPRARATSRRTCSSSPATSSCSSRRARASPLTGAIDTPAIYRVEDARRSRCAKCCAMRAARRCSPIRTASSSSASIRRSSPPRASSRSSSSTRRPAKAAARRRHGDAAGDLAAVRQCGDAARARCAAAALSAHAGHAHPRPDPGPRCADLARFLSAQEPAGADHRRRGRRLRHAQVDATASERRARQERIERADRAERAERADRDRPAADRAAASAASESRRRTGAAPIGPRGALRRGGLPTRDRQRRDERQPGRARCATTTDGGRGARPRRRRCSTS